MARVVSAEEFEKETGISYKTLSMAILKRVTCKTRDDFKSGIEFQLRDLIDCIKCKIPCAMMLMEEEEMFSIRVMCLPESEGVEGEEIPLDT